MASPVVSFDVGQTLVELDLDFLVVRLGERQISVDKDALGTALPAAWATYDQRTDEGAQHPWHAFMDALLSGAGVGQDRQDVVEWLYQQQATKNLWRKPIEPMVDLLRELRSRQVRIAAVSNSEGYVADLLGEIGLLPLFDAVIDSQRVGVAKPDPRIFALTLEQIGEADPPIRIHVGDSWSADVEGALAAGWHAIWYRSRGGTARHDPRVPIADDAIQTRAALAALGV